jgi:hypothetical protein
VCGAHCEKKEQTNTAMMWLKIGVRSNIHPRLCLLAFLVVLALNSVTEAFQPFHRDQRNTVKTTGPLHVVADVTAPISTSRVNGSSSSSNSIEFPPPLSRSDRLKRAATFWSTALPIVASYYGLISRIKLQELLGDTMSDTDQETMWKAQHSAAAIQLADTITELKGFYVKTAQIISSRQGVSFRVESCS